MRNYPYWKTIYFDGFAGSGSRRADKKSDLYIQLKITEEEERVYEGSAERVSKLDEGYRFDYYYFIEKDDKAITELESRISNYSDGKKGKLIFKAGDCNSHLIKLSEALQQTKSNNSTSKKYAALIFLDPFGMQIDWSVIERLNGSKSDIWILVPTGVIVNRLLDKQAKLIHIDKLCSFFGLTEDEIRKEFYHIHTQETLFGEETVIKKVEKPIEKIAKLYAKRLSGIWKHVTEVPLKLDNNKGVPIFHFVFASNNSNAAKIAKEIIANY
jgi:three-Cys-motif partner protein